MGEYYNYMDDRETTCMDAKVERQASNGNPVHSTLYNINTLSTCNMSK